MKISYNWLQELLPDLNSAPKDIAELLTLHSFETEVAGRLAVNPKVQVRKIIKLEPHPNADRLQLATITNGLEKITVVCGAPNIKIGQLVPYSPPGTALFDETGQDFTIKETTIRGVTSPGMLNSLRELGLHPEHAGIWILPDDLPLGTSLADHFPADTILKAEITPNRAHDCLSHLGIAREIAALLALEVKPPPLAELPQPSSSINGISLGDINIPRYMAVGFTNLVAKPSPLCLQAYLLASGAKPHNQLVDITNYVMYEIGDPTHLFDDQTLPGQILGVRPATDGEKITALDNEVYQLTRDDLVITIDDKAVAIAGIKGGAATGINPSTTSGLLESANFPPHAIQQTAGRLNLSTEASYRFARGLDPNLIDISTRRVAYLLLTSGAKITGVMDYYPKPSRRPVIKFDPNQVSQFAGLNIAPDQVKDILIRLRCQVDDTAHLWAVTGPDDRLDLNIPPDLIEEVLRVIGLDKIPSRTPNITAASRPLSDRVQWRELTRDLLAAAGFTETYNYSFSHQPSLDLVGQTLDKSIAIEITNPISPEQKYLRQSLLPGIYGHLLANKSKLGKRARSVEQAIFEIGRIFTRGDEGIVEGIVEIEHVAGISWGEEGQAHIKGTVDDILDQFSISRTDLSRFGQVGLLDTDTRLAQKLNTPVAFFELDFDRLINSAERDPDYQLTTGGPGLKYQASSKYPPVYRDLSIIVSPQVTIEQIQGLIEDTGKDLIADVDLFDEYQHQGQTSYAFHLKYQSPHRTLTDQDIEKIHHKIISVLTKELNAQIR